jgi:hypothetical protein
MKEQLGTDHHGFAFLDEGSRYHNIIAAALIAKPATAITTGMGFGRLDHQLE